MTTTNYQAFALDQEIQEVFTLDQFEQALEATKLTTLKVVTYRHGYTLSAKPVLYTEAVVKLHNGTELILGTTYGKRDTKGKLHPVSSYYKQNGSVTEELKPVQRKGIVPASVFLSKLYNVTAEAFIEIISTSRNLDSYEI